MKKIDVVYVLGNGSAETDDKPLRWSLRSLDKYADNVGRVIVAGRIPAWLSDEVVKIPTNETTKARGKAWNILYGIKAAVDGAGLVEPFLFSSDDHYFLPATDGGKHDLANWPRYCKGELPTYKQEVAEKHRIPNEYMFCLINTRAALEKEKMSVRWAAIHLNTWMDPQDVASAVAFAEERKDWTRFGFEPTCLINAFYEKRMAEADTDPGFTVYEHDRAIYNDGGCQGQLEAHLPQFSTIGGAEEFETLCRWMDTFYSTPSKYEKPVEAAEAATE